MHVGGVLMTCIITANGAIYFRTEKIITVFVFGFHRLSPARAFSHFLSFLLFHSSRTRLPLTRSGSTSLTHTPYLHSAHDLTRGYPGCNMTNCRLNLPVISYCKPICRTSLERKLQPLRRHVNEVFLGRS